MYIVDYEKIAIEIDPELLVHREDDFVGLSQILCKHCRQCKIEPK